MAPKPTTPPDLRADQLPAELLALTGPVRALRYPPQGMTSDVALVEGELRTLMVKRARRQPFRDWLRDEHAVLSALARTSLPVPAAYGLVEREAAVGPEVWLAMQQLPGQPLRAVLARERRPAVRQALLEGFGAMLRRIHATPIPPALAGAPAPWLDRMLARAGDYLARYEVDATPELLERLRRERPAPVPPTLIHGDFTLDNVLSAGAAITGVIDWALGSAGDPRYDLTLAREPEDEALRTPEEQAAFFAGYGGAPLTPAEYDYFARLYDFF